MYRPKHLPKAIDDIFRIEDYLNEHSPTAANEFTELVGKRVECLMDLPYSCPAYERDPFFRKMVLGSYILFYSVDDKRELVVIHRIFHRAQNIDQHMSEYQESI